MQSERKKLMESELNLNSISWKFTVQGVLNSPTTEMPSREAEDSGFITRPKATSGTTLAEKAAALMLE
ncbi:hypothetical protein N7516_006267 [Penicillium verrucosum]|uniref:uncharacterized protein n=1 Tax=Penicillium verrucosum TaxID=60171 RepID=UPI002545A4E3|nr:uncharacterized protein N7516_006267 [Penicillium verrucosum]KAJ5931778.1 hypothetical protein N7516_006267 [Penicillium verrucosum]